MTVYLLDTHVWMWLTEGDRRVDAVRHRLEDPDTVRLSAVSPWEIAIKAALGKLPNLRDARAYMLEQIRAQGITIQSIELDHVLHVATLPHHHRDPFDRLLVAQAQLLGSTIVTADRAIARYDVEVFDPTTG